MFNEGIFYMRIQHIGYGGHFKSQNEYECASGSVSKMFFFQKAEILKVVVGENSHVIKNQSIL